MCRKKTLSIVRKLCKFCMRTIFAIFNLCNDWRICSIEYSVRFAHTARVCRWRSKPNRALVKGSWRRVCWTRWRVCVQLWCLLDTELTNVCVDVRQECMNVCLLTISYPWLTCVSRVIHCELILPITAKFIRVCTMYVQCIPRQLA